MGRTYSGNRDKLSSSILEIVDKILASKLTEWQKVDALNLFALSKATSQIHSSLVNPTWAAGLDSVVRKKVKKAFRLPTRSPCAFFHLPTRLDGLGLHSVSLALECALVSQAVKALSSRDRLVSDTAWAQLCATATKRTGSRPSTVEDTLDFLNSPPLRNESARGDVRSLWSSVRRPLQRLKIAIGKDQSGQNGISLLYDEAAFPVRKKHTVQFVLKRAREALSLGLVLASPDQGRTFHLVSADLSSNSWIPTGKYLSFAEYRFAMRERLNLLPARSVQKRIRRISNDACRKCGRTHETLGHI